MDFIEILPLEIVEEIFQHLSSQDILNCSLVSARWRDVVNSNTVWSHICACEGINEKEYLVAEKSSFRNPIKRYQPVKNSSDRLSDICYWRSHYNQYKFVESNWKRGKYAIHQLHATCFTWPAFYNEGLLVVRTEKQFVVYSVRGEIVEFASVNFSNPNIVVENVIVLKEFLIYSQRKQIIGLKLCEDKYVESFSLSLSSENFSDIGHNLLMVTTGNYLIYIEPYAPSKLYVFNLKSGVQEKDISLEKNKREQVTVCTCLNAFNWKVYLAVTKTNTTTVYNVIEYDLIKGQWGAEFTVQSAVNNFYFADGILCALTSGGNGDDVLHVWNVKEMRVLTRLPVNGKQPILVTKEVIFHCQENTVVIESIETFIESKFFVRADTIINMNTVGRHLLAINTGDAIEVWDWGTGEKLYTPYRGVCSTSMWVDEQMIIVNKWSCNFQIIGFW